MQHQSHTFMYLPACRIIHTGGLCTFCPLTARRSSGRSSSFCRSMYAQCICFKLYIILRHDSGLTPSLFQPLQDSLP